MPKRKQGHRDLPLSTRPVGYLSFSSPTPKLRVWCDPCRRSPGICGWGPSVGERQLRRGSAQPTSPVPSLPLVRVLTSYGSWAGCKKRRVRTRAQALSMTMISYITTSPSVWLAAQAVFVWARCASPSASLPSPYRIPTYFSKSLSAKCTRFSLKNVPAVSRLSLPA